MSIKWSDKEVELIEFFSSFNQLVTVDRKFTAKDISNIWSKYYFQFPYRTEHSISHKLRELNTYDLKNDFIIYLESTNRKVLNINDIAIHYNIPTNIAETLMEILEEDLEISIYNWKKCCLVVDDALRLINQEIKREDTPTKIIYAKDFFKEQEEKKPEPEEKVISTESKDFILEKIKEIQFELSNPYTPKNRRKTLKKNLKKYKKKFGSDMETLYDKEHRSDDQIKRDEQVRDVLISKVREVEAINSKSTDNVDVKVEENINLVSFKLGIISDTHIGTKWFDEKSLKHFYKTCFEEGVTRVIHAGDLFDGSTTYAYQEKDQNLVGYNNQFNWIVKNYPKYNS